MRDDLELESGPQARTEVRVPIATRELAQVRRREASSLSDVRIVWPKVPELSSPYRLVRE